MFELVKRQRFCLFQIETTTGTNYVSLRMAWGSTRRKRFGQRRYPFKAEDMRALRDKAALLMRHRLDQGFSRRQAVMENQTQPELIQTMSERPAPILVEAWRLAKSMPEHVVKKRYRSNAPYLCQACDGLQPSGSEVMLWLRNINGAEPVATLLCATCHQG